MEILKNIVYIIVFGSRVSKIKLIRELAGDEYENIDDVFELAEKTDEQINIVLSILFNYYSDELKNN